MPGDWIYWIGGGVLGVAALVLLYWSLVADRSRGRKRCPKCWYDMNGAQGDPPYTCPECGKEIKREKKLHKTRRRWRWAMLAAIPLSGGVCLLISPGVRRDRPLSIVPSWALVMSLHMVESLSVLEELDDRITSYDNGACFGYIDTGALRQWEWRLMGSACVDLIISTDNAETRHRALWMALNFPTHYVDSPAHLPEAIEKVLLTSDAESKTIAVSQLCDLATYDYVDDYDGVVVAAASLLDKPEELDAGLLDALLWLTCCGETRICGEVVPKVIRMLDHPDADYRYLAVDSMPCAIAGSLRNDAREAVKRALQEEDEFVRGRAEEALDDFAALDDTAQ